MSVRLERGVVHLVGDCVVEDAEALIDLLQAAPGRAVDLGAAGALHAAVVQVLLALAPPFLGEPEDDFTRLWVLPALRRAASHQSVIG